VPHRAHPFRYVPSIVVFVEVVEVAADICLNTIVHKDVPEGIPFSRVIFKAIAPLPVVLECCFMGSSNPDGSGGFFRSSSSHSLWVLSILCSLFVLSESRMSMWENP